MCWSAGTDTEASLRSLGGPGRVFSHSKDVDYSAPSQGIRGCSASVQRVVDYSLGGAESIAPTRGTCDFCAWTQLVVECSVANLRGRGYSTSIQRLLTIPRPFKRCWLFLTHPKVVDYSSPIERLLTIPHSLIMLVMTRHPPKGAITIRYAFIEGVMTIPTRLMWFYDPTHTQGPRRTWRPTLTG